MIIFFVQAPNRKFAQMLSSLGVRNILSSYLYSTNIRHFEDRLQDPEFNLMIDSGAFTIQNTKTPVKLDNYICFCQRLLSKCRCNVIFVNLDVIPGKSRFRYPIKEEGEKSAKEGWNNYMTMLEAKLPVLHVYHQGEPLEYLERMCQYSNYLGISASSAGNWKQALAWTDTVFSWLHSNCKSLPRTHYFGVTKPDVLMGYPFYSVDSSTWMAGNRFGRVMNLNTNCQSLQGRKYRDLIKQKKRKDICYLPDAMYRTKINITQMLKLENFITQLWEKRGIVW